MEDERGFDASDDYRREELDQRDWFRYMADDECGLFELPENWEEL